MAKILFGVAGDGAGHATRAKCTIDHLMAEGHEVRIISSGKGYEYLSCFFDVSKTLDLRIVNCNREVSVWGTIKEWADRLLRRGLPEYMGISRELEAFRPDLVISDFEPLVAAAARLRRIPLFVIDNQHTITLCDFEYPREWKNLFLLGRATCEGIIKTADHFFVTSFFAPNTKKWARNLVTIVAPILRKEVFKYAPRTGEHVLVYMRTPERVSEIYQIITRIRDEKFVVYGLDTPAPTVGNVIYKEADADGFLRDLANAKGVITNGGHSLISEALYLGKPVFSIPTKKDFEQMINAYYIEKLGYGLFGLEPSVERVQKYLSELALFRKKIEANKSNLNGNGQLYRALDSQIMSVMIRGRTLSNRIGTRVHDFVDSCYFHLSPFFRKRFEQ